MVPWWSEECQQAVRDRNRAFRISKRTRNQLHLFQYKRAQAFLRRRAKRAAWTGMSWNRTNNAGGRSFGGRRWGRQERVGISGVGEWGREGNIRCEKVELMVRSFVKVHRLEKISEEGIRRM